MKKIVLFLLVFVLSACEVEDVTTYVVEDNDFLVYLNDTEFDVSTYYMELYLDEEEETLKVEGQLIYLAEEDTDHINLRVYPNAPANMYSSYSVDFEYLRLNGVEKNVSFYSNGKTLIKLPLDSTLETGEELKIDFSYTFDYWSGEGRISSYFNYFITMFFYPIVQLNNDDPIEDYNYSFTGESLYTHLSNYYVSLNVPSDYEVAASGSVSSKSTVENRTVINYILNKGRDFSFSASSNYEVHTRELGTMTYNIYANRRLSDEEVEQGFYILDNAFELYEEYIGDYPYDYFNLEYGYIYGMESTGVVYCSTDISEYTVVHEIIHQWLFFIIHNDQAREPFLDEALTTYLTYLYFEHTDSVEHAEGYLDYRSSMREDLHNRFLENRGTSLLSTVHEYEFNYAYNIYYHGPTVYRYYFDNIATEEDVLKEFLNAYYNEYAFKEVTTEEMLDLLEEISGVEGTKDWFMEELEYLDKISGLN